MKHGIWALLLAFTNSALAVPDWTPARIAKIEPERARVTQSGAEASIYCHRKKWPPGGGSDGASQMSGRFRNKVLACLAFLTCALALPAFCGPMGFKESWMAMGDISPNWQVMAPIGMHGTASPRPTGRSINGLRMPAAGTCPSTT